MLTSLDRDKSQNFFSRLRIKFLKVEYRECNLSCAYSTLHAPNDEAKRVPNPGGWMTSLLSIESWVA